jgi:hypothetical protein
MKTINTLLIPLFSLNILDIITTYIGLTTKPNITDVGSFYNALNSVYDQSYNLRFEK